MFQNSERTILWCRVVHTDAPLYTRLGKGQRRGGHCFLWWRGQGSSVVWWRSRNRSSLPAGERAVSTVSTRPCDPPSSLFNRHHSPFPRGVKADDSLPSNAEVKNAWSYTPIPPYAFIARLSLQHLYGFWGRILWQWVILHSMHVDW